MHGEWDSGITTATKDHHQNLLRSLCEISHRNMSHEESIHNHVHLERFIDESD